MRRGEGDDLWFVSRKKDIIIRGGTNISPVEVEQALVAAHPGVEQAAVVGIPDTVLGQRVFAFVKLAKGMRDTIVSEILGNVATRLASYKVPEGLRVLDELARNALSKGRPWRPGPTGQARSEVCSRCRNSPTSSRPGASLEIDRRFYR
jgi:acyl-CoA synthetase (AMP-forming)/AMP-acid ligase II